MHCKTLLYVYFVISLINLHHKFFLEHLGLERAGNTDGFGRINWRTDIVGKSGNFYSGLRSYMHHMSQLNCKTIAFKSWWCNRKTRKHLDLSSSRLLGWIHYIYIYCVGALCVFVLDYIYSRRDNLIQLGNIHSN